MITPDSTDKERYLDARAKADARIALLRAMVAGKRCPYPGKYLESCGECAVCAFSSEDGAEKFLAKFGPHAFIPGTSDQREMQKKINEDLGWALPERASIRDLQRRRELMMQEDVL